MAHPIVVIMPTWVGDSIMALASLREPLEREEVLLLGQAHILELVSGEFNHLLLKMDKKSILSGAKALLKQKGHKGVLLPNSFGSAVMGLLGGLCTLTGTPKDSRGWLLSRKVEPVSEHQAWRYREILKAGGIGVDDDPKPWVSLPQRAFEKAGSLIGGNGSPLLAVHPGSSKRERCWPLQRFISVCRALGEEGWRVVILGGRKEKEMAFEMEKDLGSLVALNVPKQDLSLAEMAAILSKCKLFLGNDSGPMHLASALGVKVVAVFGSTSPNQTGPLLPENMKREVWSAFECSPCRERFFKECTPVHGIAPCLEAIFVEEVLEAVKEVISV